MRKKKDKTLNKISLDELKKFYKDLDKSVLKIFVWRGTKENAFQARPSRFH